MSWLLPLWGLLGVGLGMAALWARQLRTRNATSVDAAWAFALGALAVLYAALREGELARRTLVAVIAAAWAGRLFLHLFWNRVRGEAKEDGRYRAMREHWGERAPLYFFVFYQGQAVVAVLFSLVFYAAMGRAGPLDGWDYVGAAVAVIAVAGEMVADQQLARWRRQHPGKTCRAGLWRYSRHPNYFFEWTHWFAYVCIGGGHLLTWLGPVLMFLFLFRLTGIPYTEKQALKSRGEDYRRYQETTSVFFPWPPKEDA